VTRDELKSIKEEYRRFGELGIASTARLIDALEREMGQNKPVAPGQCCALCDVLATLRQEQGEREALTKAALGIYVDARASHLHHLARSTGGVSVNHHPGYPPNIAARIVRALGPHLRATLEAEGLFIEGIDDGKETR
jgi:hypothetical protein